ncbi:SdrD B-like domain-containing protein [Azohydromonas caseinilytica]|uniref:DUF11 domain-containing protein n=1 Tax=Azohydromonas caseinilytica TaxID=2728836 RepID=A0A848F4K4_9BURK|nr:SdrD B-like domain-containing protein [Azohydromonas caseinilytica]NML14997.1 DUF11 domain-containing protein [Azohydromonas caseinilytica]
MTFDRHLCRPFASLGAWLMRLLGLLVLGLACAGAAQAQLAVTRFQDNPHTVLVNGRVAYTIRVGDDSGAAHNGVTLNFDIQDAARYLGTDPLPAGVSCSGLTLNQLGTGRLVCTGINVQRSSYVELVVNLQATTEGVLRTEARVVGTSQSQRLATTVVAGADLRLTVGTPATAPAGSWHPVVFTIVNRGTVASSRSTLTYNVPDRFRLDEGSLPSGCSLVGSTLTCERGELAVNATMAIRVSGQIGAGGGSTLVHSADIAAKGSVGDTDTTNNSATGATAVLPGTELKLVKSQSVGGLVEANKPFNYSFATSYTGNFPVGVRLTDPLPSNMCMAGARTFTHNRWNCTVPKVCGEEGAAGATLSCSYGASSGSADFNVALDALRVAVKALSPVASVTNTATVSAPGVTPATHSVVVSVTGTGMDLVANKTSSWKQDAVPVGTVYRYSLSATNRGPKRFNDTDTLTLTDRVPANFVVTGIGTGGKYDCTRTPSAPLPQQGPFTLTCVSKSRAFGIDFGKNSPAVEVSGYARAASAGFTNEVCVSSNRAAEDEVGENNCATVTHRAHDTQEQADVRVKKRVRGPGATPGNRQLAGQPVVWEVEVVNDGPAQARSVKVSDIINDVVYDRGYSVVTLPGNARMNDCALIKSGTSLMLSNCVIDELPRCAESTPTSAGTCPRLQISVLHTYTQGDLDSEGNFQRKNSVNAQATAGAADPNSGNNGIAGNNSSGDVYAYLRARTDLQVRKVANPDPVRVGQLLRYVITASNADTSPGPAYGVTVTDTLPLNVKFLSATITPVGSAPSNGNCTTKPAAGALVTEANRKLECSWPSMAPNTQQTVTVEVRPLAYWLNRGPMTNRVEVHNTTPPELDPVDNTALVSTAITPPQYDLVVDQFEDKDPVDSGEDVIYTLRATNNGPSMAEKVVLTTKLPIKATLPVNSTARALTFQELITPPGVTCTTPGVLINSPGGTVICEFPELNGTGAGTVPGDTSSMSVQIRLRGVDKARFELDSSVGFKDTGLNQYDPQGNNLKKIDTGVRLAADVEVVSKTPVLSGTSDALPFVTASQTFDWLVQLRNNGQDAEDTRFTDTLPAGMVLNGTPMLTVRTGTFEPAAPSCTGSPGGTSVSCTVTTMPAGGTAEVRIPVRLTGSPADGARFDNTASLVTLGSGDTNGGTDPRAGNNFKTGSVTVNATAVSGYVYHDLNGNGLKDANEPGIPGVTVTLSGTRTDGQPFTTLTTTSNSSGLWSFLSVPPGTYTVTETRPSGYEPGITRAGSGGGSVPTTGTGVVSGPRGSTADVIRNIVVTASSGSTNNLFGEVKLSSLAGQVYLDENRDDQRNGLETGLPGNKVVRVALSGTDFLGRTVSRQADTAAGTGTFRFDGLLPGTYALAETQPADYDDGAEAIGTEGGTLAAPDTITGIRLGSEKTATGYLFGERRRTTGGTVSGYVYHDLNGNGSKDPAERGIRTTLTLRKSTEVVATVTSDPDTGYWEVPNLQPATYSVEEAQPTGFEPGITVAGTVSGTGSTPGTVASRTDNTIRNIVLAAGGSSTNNLFGEVKLSSLAGQVYLDANRDGQRNSSETGLPDSKIVRVALSGTDFLGRTVSRQAGTAAGTGTFRFDGLLPGTYALTETQPEGYDDGAETIGTEGGTLAAPDTIGDIRLGSDKPATGYLFGEIARATQADVQVVSKTAVARGTATAVARVRQMEVFDWLVELRNGGGLAAAQVRFSDTLPAGMELAGAPVLTVTAGSFDPATPGCSGSAGGTSVSCAITTMPAGGTASVRIPVRIAGAQPSGTVFTNTATLVTTATPDSNGGADPTQGNNFNRGSVTLQRSQATLSGRVWRDADHDRRYGSGEATVGGWTVQVVACEDGSTRCAASGFRVVRTTTTAQDGTYRLDNVEAGKYQLRFVNPAGRVVGGVWPTDPDLNQGANAPRSGMPWIVLGDDLPEGKNVIVNQDLPLDPGGVVYDGTTGRAVAGASVRFAGPSGFDPARHLLGGVDTVTTDSSGDYQFFLLPDAPVGAYTLSVTPPAGYRNSTALPPAESALDMGSCSAPGVTLADQDRTDPCLVSPQTRPALPITAPYFLRFNFPGLNNGAQNVVNNHLPVEPVSAPVGRLIELRKSTSKVTVKKAEPVPYTITARYTGASPLLGVALVDTLPPGFKYLEGSLTVQTLPNGPVLPVRPVIQGRQLTLENQRFAVGETKKLQMVLAVGVGVSEGEYVNSVVARRGGGDVSNVATAAVRVVPDALLDCTDVIGKVYDDRNANGVQDEGEPGLANVRIATVNGLLVHTDAQGRYHIACAAVPREDTGSNLVLKVDERTLPSGYRVTTENPASERITRGKAVKVNFGATVHRVVRLALQSRAFADAGTALRPEHEARLAQVIEALEARPSVLRVAYEATEGEDAALGQARAEALRETLLERWKAHGRAKGLALFNLDVEVEHVPASTSPTRR